MRVEKKIPIVKTSWIDVPVINFLGEWTLPELFTIVVIAFILFITVKNIYTALFLICIVITLITLPKQFIKSVSTFRLLIAIIKYIINSLKR